MKNKKYTIMYEVKKEDKDFPLTFRQLVIKLKQIDRKEKLDKLKWKEQ